MTSPKLVAISNGCTTTVDVIGPAVARAGRGSMDTEASNVNTKNAIREKVYFILNNYREH
jgi:hypothetical protein